MNACGVPSLGFIYTHTCVCMGEGCVCMLVCFAQLVYFKTRAHSLLNLVTARRFGCGSYWLTSIHSLAVTVSDYVTCRFGLSIGKILNDTVMITNGSLQFEIK